MGQSYPTTEDFANCPFKVFVFLIVVEMACCCSTTSNNSERHLKQWLQPRVALSLEEHVAVSGDI